RVEKLERGLAPMKFASGEALPLLAAFLTLPAPERFHPLEMSPELQRRKTIELLAAWILTLAEAQPLVLLVEDLHWCDPSSLEVLGRIIEQSPTARVLVLGTARPEFEAPWPARWNVTTVQLARLTKREAREMVTALGANDLSAGTVDTLVRRADGVP